MGDIGMKRKEVDGNQQLPVQSLFLSNLFELMTEKGLTSSDIAIESGLNESLVKKVIEGELRPSRSILQRLSLASCVGLTYKTLVTWCLLDDSLRYAEANRTRF